MYRRETSQDREGWELGLLAGAALVILKASDQIVMLLRWRGRENGGNIAASALALSDSPGSSPLGVSISAVATGVYPRWAALWFRALVSTGLDAEEPARLARGAMGSRLLATSPHRPNLSASVFLPPD